MSEEEANAVRAENDQIRFKREEGAEMIANKFACFKKDFMSAPIRKGMNGVLNKTNDKGWKPVQIDYRKNERYWVFADNTSVSTVFEIDFETTEDQALARIFLLELADAKRNVMNAPGITYHDKAFPENV